MDATKNVCTQCGGEYVFDIDKQAFKCPFCDAKYEQERRAPIVEHDFSRLDHQNRDAVWNGQTQTIGCSSCGAEIVVPAEVTALACPCCGSSQVLRGKQEAGIPPDAVIPFRIDKNGAGEVFRRWISRRFWAPNMLKTLFQQDKLKPVYLPYWTFDADTDCPYTAQGGEVYYVTVGSGDKKRTERRVRWYNVRGRIQHFFDDILVNAQKIKHKFLSKLENFNTKDAKPFSIEYLSGFAAEKYTVPPSDAYVTAQEKMKHELESMAASEVLRRYDEVRGICVSPSFLNVKYKHLLVPVWFTAFYYQDKLYELAINAQSGAVAGQYPKSKVKIAIAVALGVIAAAVILYFGYNYM